MANRSLCHRLLVACQMRKWFFYDVENCLMFLVCLSFFSGETAKLFPSSCNFSCPCSIALESNRQFSAQTICRERIWRAGENDKHVHKSHWRFFRCSSFCDFKRSHRSGGDEAIDLNMRAIIYMFLWIYWLSMCRNIVSWNTWIIWYFFSADERFPARDFLKLIYET